MAQSEIVQKKRSIEVDVKRRSFKLEAGDLLAKRADVIVCPTDVHLGQTYPLSSKIYGKGGKRLQEQWASYTHVHAGHPDSHIVICPQHPPGTVHFLKVPAFSPLKAKRVAIVASADKYENSYWMSTPDSAELALLNILTNSENIGLKSVAFPILDTNNAAGRGAIVTAMVGRAIWFLALYANSIRQVSLVVLPDAFNGVTEPVLAAATSTLKWFHGAKIGSLLLNSALTNKDSP